MNYDLLMEEQESRFKKQIQGLQAQIEDLKKEKENALNQTKEFWTQVQLLIEKCSQLQQDNMKLQDQLIQHQEKESRNNSVSMQSLFKTKSFQDSSFFPNQTTNKKIVKQNSDQNAVKNYHYKQGNNFPAKQTDFLHNSQMAESCVLKQEQTEQKSFKKAFRFLELILRLKKNKFENHFFFGLKSKQLFDNKFIKQLIQQKENFNAAILEKDNQIQYLQKVLRKHKILLNEYQNQTEVFQDKKFPNQTSISKLV